MSKGNMTIIKSHLEKQKHNFTHRFNLKKFTHRYNKKNKLLTFKNQLKDTRRAVQFG